MKIKSIKRVLSNTKHTLVEVTFIKGLFKKEIVKTCIFSNRYSVEYADSGLSLPTRLWDPIKAFINSGESEMKFK